MEHMDFEIKADNDNEQEKVQQIDHDINDYKKRMSQQKILRQVKCI